MDAKPLLKEALQAEVGLPIDPSIPVIGFIGRLEEQKGSDILAEAIPEFIGENAQIVVLVSILLNLFSTRFELVIVLGKQADRQGCVFNSLLGNWQKIHGEAA